jgi:hypothetical protein
VILGVAVLLAVLGAMAAAFVAFVLYSRSPAWRSSELRMATMRLLIVIGPMFGVRVDMPPPDRPAVMTPGPDPPEGSDRDAVPEPPSTGGDR